MKRTIALLISALMLISALASCARNNTDTAATSSTSVPLADGGWLKARLGEIPANLTVGTGDSLGIDMTAFEDDGYFIRSDKDETVVCAKNAIGLDRAVRAYAKAYEKGEAATLDVTYHEGFRVKELRIGGADISEFTVVRPANANANVDFAISEFVRLIKKATGVTVGVSDTDANGHKVTFTLSDDPKYKHDGYTYEVKDGNLNITGAVQRGAMNGVWRFLTHELDWDGLMYGDSVLACSDLVDVPNGTTRSETPAFTYYHPYMDFYEKKYQKDAGTPTNEQNSWGEFAQACHGMQNNRFCDEDYDSRQICYTDESRYAECLENVIAYIERYVNSGAVIGKDFRYIDIAQGDNSGFCSCKSCRAVFKEEQSNSGAMIRFSNRLADEINGMYDGGIYFLVFAYAGTNIAPAVTKPNDWIYVTFCFDVNCTNHKMDGSECTGKILIADREGRDNNTYVGWLESWLGMTKQIYVWYYDLDNCMVQYNAIRTLYHDMRFLRDEGIEGIFWESEMTGLGVQFIQHMVGYELNWNVDISEEEYYDLVDRVLKKEYGDGAPFIREYLDIQTEAQLRADCWHCWGEEQIVVEKNYYLSHYDEIRSLFDSAIALADSAECERLAKLYSIHTYYLGASSAYHDAYLQGQTDVIDYWSEEYKTMVDVITGLGFELDKLPSWSGYKRVVKPDLVSEAWIKWIKAVYGYTFNYYRDMTKMTPPIEIPTA